MMAGTAPRSAWMTSRRRLWRSASLGPSLPMRARCSSASLSLSKTTAAAPRHLAGMEMGWSQSLDRLAAEMSR